MFESIPFFFQSEDEISAGKGNDETDQQTPDGQFETITEEDLLDTPKEESFDGMIMSANVARNSPDYVRHGICLASASFRLTDLTDDFASARFSARSLRHPLVLHGYGLLWWSFESFARGLHADHASGTSGLRHSQLQIHADLRDSCR